MRDSGRGGDCAKFQVAPDSEQTSDMEGKQRHGVEVRTNDSALEIGLEVAHPQ
jgi:hypothetical protein